MTSYTYQTRRSADAEWTTVAAPWDHAESTESITDTMQTAGLRYSELAAHVADLHAGHVLTADNGHQFRAVDAAEAAAEAVAANQADYAAWKVAQGAPRPADNGRPAERIADNLAMQVAMLMLPFDADAAIRDLMATARVQFQLGHDTEGALLANAAHKLAHLSAEPADPQSQRGYVSEYGPQH